MLPDNRKSSDTLQQLGSWIRSRRKAYGDTQSVAAQRLFVSERTLRKLEQGDPGVATGLLANALALYGGLDRLETAFRSSPNRFDDKAGQP